jgi:hypothetical protein
MDATEHSDGTGSGARIAIGFFFLILGAVVLFSTLHDLLIVPIGVALFLSLTLASFVRPVPAFLALVFVAILVPLDLSTDVGFLPRVGPTRIYMGAFLLGIFVRLLVFRSILPGRRAVLPLFGGACLYILSSIVSTFVSVAPVVSVYAVFGREILEQLLLFYLFLYFFQLPGFWRQLRNTLYVATALTCLFAFWEVYSGDNPFLPLIPESWPDFRAGILRCRSTFFHPIAYACFLNLVFPFVVIDFLATRRTEVRVVMGVLGVLILVAALLTVSRAPWIILALEIAVLIGWECRHDLRRMAFILTLCLIAISTFFLAYQLNGTVQDLFQPFINPGKVEEGSTEYYRVVVFEAVWERVQSSRIFFGYGPNAFNYANIEVTYDNTTRVIQEPDLHYARILFEFGAVGTGLILLLIGRGVWAGLRALGHTNREGRRWIVAGLVGIVGFVFVNFTVSMFSMFPLGMIFWMCMAVVLSQGEGDREEADRPESTPLV